MLQWIKLEASSFFFFDIAETREDEVTVLILAGMRV